MNDNRNTDKPGDQAQHADQHEDERGGHSNDVRQTTTKSLGSRRVFISHKGKDKAAAEEMGQALEVYGLKIFVSARIRPGVQWPKEIWDNLWKADWLLLLYTDPSEEWDWCLFEAGFFAGSGKGPESRLVCLHTEDVDPPMPVQHWQSVNITNANRLEQFLRDLFSGVNEPLLESQEMLQGLADRIAGAFHRTAVRKLPSAWLTEFVVLALDPAQVEQLKKNGRVPADVSCGLEQRESINIFGHGTGKCTMGNLEEGLDEHYREWWLKGLGGSLRAASLNKRPIPRIPILYSPTTRKDYHVILHRVDHFSNGRLEFCLLFVDRIPENRDEQTSDLRLAGDMLKLARSFRWKILTKFRRDISVLKQHPEKTEEIKDRLHRLKLSMEWVAGEATRLDVLTPEDVLEVFEDKEDKEKIAEIITKTWPTLFTKLNHGIEAQNLDEVLDALNGMLRLNKDYLIRSARRYGQLLQKLPDV